MDIKQFSANIPPSKRISLVGNVANNWRNFKQDFLNYSIASRLSREADTSYQTSVFLATIGEDSYDIYEGLKFNSEENKTDLEKVMKFKDFFRWAKKKSL